MKGNVPNAKVLEDQACFSSNTASDQVQEDQAALSSTEVVPENKKAGHQLENDNLSSDEPHQSYSVETRKAWCTLEFALASNLDISVSGSNKMDTTLGSIERNLQLGFR